MTRKDPVKNTVSRIKALGRSARMTVLPTSKSPDEALGELFRVAQLSRLHPDGKTFVDLVPSAQLRTIARKYRKESAKPDFDLRSFVQTHFKLNESEALEVSRTNLDAISHVDELWSTLTRSAEKPKGSLIPLPHRYVVPGGRFQEQFYWDSYFIMLGLESSSRHDLTASIMSNNSHMFRKFGFIPTGNRTYFTSRSQPPFYAAMVELVSNRKGATYLTSRLPYLLQEYHFWNKGGRFGFTTQRRVRLEKNEYLNRYYDNLATPRPESYSEDIETADAVPARNDKLVYRDLRAAAESGWDFSSRWLEDPKRLETIRTTEIIPPDLNSLLFQLEMTIADAYTKLYQLPLARHYRERARKRRALVTKYLWDEKSGFFMDYHFPSKLHTPHLTLAGVFPLYSGLASEAQAKKVARTIETKFLHDGGVVTTLEETGEQWDWPNGWAPLQWTTIVGLRRYGHHELADAIKNRWLATNDALYANEHKFVEKYNVVDPTRRGGGGEYKLQDGFGWTNGVYRALKDDLDITLSERQPLFNE